MTVVGVDACKGGWVAVVLADGEPPAALLLRGLDELELKAPAAAGVGVDIPIGLPVDRRRRADEAARVFLGPRRTSVFHTPPRAVLEAGSHREANERSRELTGVGVSQQAYALRSKILEADAWLHTVELPVWEVHPEVSFTLMLGHPPSASKKSWAGMTERAGALRDVDVDLDGLEGPATLAGVDDVLDAAAAAWSARRLVRGEGHSFPDPPERDPVTDRLIAIWG